MKGRQNGGVMVGRKKSVMITCAEDLELVAKAEKNMKETLKKFNIYIKKKS